MRHVDNLERRHKAKVQSNNPHRYSTDRYLSSVKCFNTLPIGRHTELVKFTLFYISTYINTKLSVCVCVWACGCGVCVCVVCVCVCVVCVVCVLCGCVVW